MENISSIVLAAGKGTRMKSSHCKVLHEVAGKTMLSYVLDSLKQAGILRICVVVGHQANRVIDSVKDYGVETTLQEPQLGTGHAVGSAAGTFENYTGDILILCGDTPLITSETIKDFVKFHREKKSRLSVMTTRMKNPFGYGRIVRDIDELVMKIVEERDATDIQRQIHEINTGIYLVNAEMLFRLLKNIKAENSQKEYYLTDVVGLARAENEQVHGYILEESFQATGVNTRRELAEVSKIIWNANRERLMSQGVTLLDPDTVYVDEGISIGADTIIHPSVHIHGKTTIGTNCIVESGCYLLDSSIGNSVHILQSSRLNQVVVHDGASIGPMAHLRPLTDVGENVRIGNFVEVKKTKIGKGSKAAHLTYLGDSTIGQNVNVGCGVITCNYDGRKKHPTTIGDDCFIGSDVQLVAPVSVGSGSLIGAGTTLTRDVPPQNLAVSRCKQKNYPLRKGQGPISKDEDR